MGLAIYHDDLLYLLFAIFLYIFSFNVDRGALSLYGTRGRPLFPFSVGLWDPTVAYSELPVSSVEPALATHSPSGALPASIAVSPIFVVDSSGFSNSVLRFQRAGSIVLFYVQSG